MNDLSGIVGMRSPDRVVLRVRSLSPYTAELTSEQIGVIADIAERYGAGFVHVTPRQTVEIPFIEKGYIAQIRERLSQCGLSTGSTGNSVRHVTACSRWCLFNSSPMSGVAERLNNDLAIRELPGKVDISLSGCDFSCVRSRTSDIGVIARTDVEITDKKCKKCSLCIKEPLGCQVDAIRITDDGVEIDTERCVRCGFCTNVCRPGTLRVRSRGFDIIIGGRGGIKPAEGVYFKTEGTEESLMNTIRKILDRYSELALDGERIADVLQREGKEVFLR